MSHATRHALNTLIMSCDTIDALDEIAIMSQDSTDALDHTIDLDVDMVSPDMLDLTSDWYQEHADIMEAY